MNPRRLAVAVAIILVLFSDRVLAEDLPFGHYVVKNTAVVDVAGAKFNLPVGTHVVTPDLWGTLETEVKRLQDQETRLKAENQSLKNALNAWSPGIGTLAVIAGSVVLVGVVVHYWP